MKFILRIFSIIFDNKEILKIYHLILQSYVTLQIVLQTLVKISPIGVFKGNQQVKPFIEP